MRLRSDEVHVWQAVLDSKDIAQRDLENFLSEDEISRANRFHFEKDRKQFVVSRGILRTLLGNYLGSQPNELSLLYSPYGKPLVENKEGLRFNLAHSQNVAVFGFSIDREIGVDVEQIRQISDMEVLAARFFSHEEPHKHKDPQGVMGLHELEQLYEDEAEALLIKKLESIKKKLS